MMWLDSARICDGIAVTTYIFQFFRAPGRSCDCDVIFLDSENVILRPVLSFPSSSTRKFCPSEFQKWRLSFPSNTHVSTFLKTRAVLNKPGWSICL